MSVVQDVKNYEHISIATLLSIAILFASCNKTSLSNAYKTIRVKVVAKKNFEFNNNAQSTRKKILLKLNLLFKIEFLLYAQ